MGFVIWVFASVYTAVEKYSTGPNPMGWAFMYLGFFIMVGGPVLYIVVLPVAGWLKRRRARGGPGAPPSSP